MRPSRLSTTILVAVLSLSLSGGALALATGPAGAATKWKVTSTGKASGQYSLANTNAEILSPVKIELAVNKASLVQWSMDCVKGSKVVATKGKKTFVGAGTMQLKVTKSADNCELAANAQNYGSGTIKISIESAG
jgi:hypothetical protein